MSLIVTGKQPHQESLPFAIDDHGLFETFYAGPNEAAVSLLKKAVLERAHEQFYVFGPHGSGKSHLLTALFRMVHQPTLNVFYVDMPLVVRLSPLLLDVDPPSVVMLDNIEAIAGDPAWELSLFGFYNRWLDMQPGVFIATATPSADRLPFLRADLNTRFENGVTLSLERLDGAGCAEALKLRGKRRGFDIPDKVAAYLVRHCNRDMPSLIEILDRLDRASLQEQHELTIPFVRRILGLESS